MRKFSLGAILSVLLVVVVLFWGPLSEPALAQPGITFGFAVDGSGLIVSSELGEEMGAYLQQQLLLPVKVRSFTTEDHLYNWLTRFREVDVAWLGSALLDRIPDGELVLLSRNLDHFSGLFQGSIVVHQGLNVVLSQQLKDAFLDMHESSAGQLLLAKLEISRFVSPTFAQTPAVATPQPDPDPAIPTTERKPLAVAEQQTEVAIEQDVAKTDVVEIQTNRTSVTQGVVAEQTARQEEPPVSQVDELEQRALPVAEQEGKAFPAPPVVPTPPTPPASKMNQEEPIALVADYLEYNSEEDSYEAKGDVILRQAGVELKSEALLWQSATQDAAAQGSVSLRDADTVVSGERLQYNLATGQGQVRDGQVFVREGNFHLIGEQIEKHGQAEYSVKDGSFTTCDGEIPDWKFSASEVDVTLGGYARAKNVWFHIKDVPVLYTPYLMFPVKTERESGLLTPSFGYSKRKGTKVSTAWYQVIDRHMDATVYLDYFSQIGLGKGLEYRYALTGQNNGQALYYHVTGTGDVEAQDMEAQGINEDFPDLDYYRWKHRGNLPGGWRLMADIEYTDEKLFFEEFGDVAADYNREKTVSTIMLRRNWQKLNAVGFARYIKDLESNNDTTLQSLPELGLGLTRYRLGETALYAGLESYATRFWRDEGDRGERLYLRPSLSAAFKPGSWLEVTPEVAFYERFYSTKATDTDDFIPEFSVALSTRLEKSFDVDLLGADRVQHSIEPTVTYTYVPDEEQDDLPLFDLQDRIYSRNDITYALVNRLVARSVAADGSNTYRDLFYLRLSQSYRDEARNDILGEDRPFSDLRVEMDFKPLSNFSLDVESLIPVYGDSGFRTLTVGSKLSDNMANSVSANYTYKDVEFEKVATDYVTFQVDTPILKPLYVRFRQRYDFQENRTLEDFVGFEYRAKCWSLMLTYKTRYIEDDDNDHEIGFMFVLAGLGPSMGFANGADNAIE